VRNARLIADQRLTFDHDGVPLPRPQPREAWFCLVAGRGPAALHVDGTPVRAVGVVTEHALRQLLRERRVERVGVSVLRHLRARRLLEPDAMDGHENDHGLSPSAVA